MLNYKVSLLKSAIAKADASGNYDRQSVYYPQLIKVEKMDIFGLIDAIMNLGSTAFTRGEWTGVVSDLGSSIAQLLISGYKVEIPGLGTFAPVLNTTQSNVKDPSKINSGNFSCSAKFTPDARFTNVLANVVWKRDVEGKNSSTGSASYKMTFNKQDNNANLRFVIDPAVVGEHINASNVSVLVNGLSVGRVVVERGNLYINGVIGDDETLTNATVKITMPAVQWEEGEETYSYDALTFEFKGITQTGNVGGKQEVE